MAEQSESLKPGGQQTRVLRQRLSWRGELVLAMFPTATVLLVLGVVEVLSKQRLLFASLASSAFLIYLDPEHGTNTIRSLVLSHGIGASLGWLLYVLLGAGYAAGATAMTGTIVAMILLDAVHPPAVSTSLSFAFRAGSTNSALLFGLAVAIIVVLVLLERSALWLLKRMR